MTSELLDKATGQDLDVVSVKLLTSFLCVLFESCKLLWKSAEPWRVEFNLKKLFITVDSFYVSLNDLFGSHQANQSQALSALCKI